MGRVSYKKIKEKIQNDYPNIKMVPSDNKHTHAKDGVIYLLPKDYNPKDMVAIFNILHELGHVFNDKPDMRRHEREWRATTWAIDAAEKYGVTIPQWRKDNFQADVLFWYGMEKDMLKLKCNMNRRTLKLKWRD